MQAKPTNPNAPVYFARPSTGSDSLLQNPNAQSDIQSIRSCIRDHLTWKRILEVGCGTGYWSSVLGNIARFTTSTDPSEQIIQKARTANRHVGRVFFLTIDPFSISHVLGEYDAGFSACWYSTLPRQETGRFMEEFSQALPPGSPIILIDERYHEGTSAPISRTDEHGNSYVSITLADGSTSEYIRNTPDWDTLDKQLSPFGKISEFEEFSHFWFLVLETNS